MLRSMNKINNFIEFTGYVRAPFIIPSVHSSAKIELFEKKFFCSRFHPEKPELSPDDKPILKQCLAVIALQTWQSLRVKTIVMLDKNFRQMVPNINKRKMYDCMPILGCEPQI